MNTVTIVVPCYNEEPVLPAFLHECDAVATRRSNQKGEPFIRSLLSRCFYRFINSISETEFVPGERDFRLMKRHVVFAVLSLCESTRFTKGIYERAGFDTRWLSFDNVERKAGDTKWSIRSLFDYAIDGITAFSAAPLQIASAMSLLMFIAFVVALVVIVVRKFMFGDPVDGWASIACSILLVGSFQLLCIGILGNYLSKTYLESKGRPAYIIREDSDNGSC